MRKLFFTLSLVVLVCVWSVSAGAASSHGPTTAPPHGPTSVTHGPSSTSPHSTTTPTRTSTHVKGTSTATTSSGASTTSSTGATTGSGTTTVGKGPTPPISPIAQKIASKPQLAQRITALLPINPKTGKPLSLNQAALGFRNQGQFIAALRAAHRLNCPTCFMQLKTDMTKKGMSLGQAIQDVRHTSASAAAAEARASERDADRDLGTRPTSTSTTSHTKSTSSPSGSTTTTTSTRHQ
jgi:hypothetical protein